METSALSSSSMGYVYDYGSHSFSYYGSEGSISGGGGSDSTSSSSSATNPENTPEMKRLYEIIVGLYVGLLLLLVLAFVWRLRRLEWNLKSTLMSAQGGISIFMFLFLAVRVAYFTLYSIDLVGDWLLYLNRIALLLLFTVFSLVLFRWVHSLERKFNKPTMFVATTVLIVVLLNIITYTIEIVAIILTLHNETNKATSTQNTYGKFAAFFMGLTYALIAGCFFVYGWRFWILIARFKKAKQTMIREVKHHQPGRSMIFGGIEKHEADIVIVQDNNNNNNNSSSNSSIEMANQWEAHLRREIYKMLFFTTLFTFCFGLRGFFWIYNSLQDKATWLIMNLKISTIVSYLVPEIPVSLGAIWISAGKWRPLPTSQKIVTPHIIANSDIMDNLSVNSPLLYKGEAEVLFDD
eukprot:TRINITY_DN6218_c0_g2_i1.p1 TRINITY_DN6218_c0_g2~~TRINITY_DN6218_c0_g2_i1.p1  ORF type:complete len:408 (-),score=102.17 TRINITY_DN6218_c0_g2_i1:90-1313(-)